MKQQDLDVGMKGVCMQGQAACLLTCHPCYARQLSTLGCHTQDLLDHPFLNLIYYTACELVPSALVLYILRKLPPRRSQQGYQQIPVR